MGMPILPEQFDEHDLDADELIELWRSLIAEIMDPEYQSRTHGNRRTYDAGCRGPMCCKATREHARRRTGSNRSSKYMHADMIVDYWRPIAEMQVIDAFDRITRELTS